MHASVEHWVAQKVRNMDLNKEHLRVLECGSQNVNGSVRPHFNKVQEYVGMDMHPGNGVDLVARSDEIPFPDNNFDVVVSTEMLEHDPYPWKSLPEMARVVKPQGYVLITTRGPEFPRHDYPDDFWRFTQSAIQVLFDEAGLTTIELIDDDYPGHSGVFAIGRK